MSRWLADEVKAEPAWAFIVEDFERFWGIDEKTIVDDIWFGITKFLRKVMYLRNTEGSTYSAWLMARERESGPEGVHMGEVQGSDAAKAAFKKVRRARSEEELESQFAHVGATLEAFSV